MRQSRRARRMSMHHARGKKTPGFNLVSLMDIFTILVFFLLVNSQEVQKIPPNKAVQLPESSIDNKTDDSLVITITKDALLVDGDQIATLAEIQASDAFDIPELVAAMESEYGKKLIATGEGDKTPKVTVMGDGSTPYNMLHRIMQSFSGVDVEKISMAVIQKAPEASE